MLTVLPVWIPVSKAECRTVKLSWIFNHALKTRWHDVCLPLTQRQLSSWKIIQSSQGILQHRLYTSSPVCPMRPLQQEHCSKVGAVICTRDRLSFWHLSGIKVLRLKHLCCTMSWPTFPHQAGIYHSTSTLSISHKTWLGQSMHIQMEPELHGASEQVTSCSTLGHAER